MNDSFTHLLDEETLQISAEDESTLPHIRKTLPRLWRMLAQVDDEDRDRLLRTVLEIDSETPLPADPISQSEQASGNRSDDSCDSIPFENDQTIIESPLDREEWVALSAIKELLSKIEEVLFPSTSADTNPDQETKARSRRRSVSDGHAGASDAADVLDELRQAVGQHFRVLRRRVPGLTASEYLSTPELFSRARRTLTDRDERNESRLVGRRARSDSSLRTNPQEESVDASVPEFRPGPLGQLPLSMQWALRSQMTTESYGPGATIIAEAEQAQCLFVCCSGRANVAISTSTGEQNVIGQIGPGQVIGEMALMGIATRTATVTAEERCDLLRLTKEDFLSLVGKFQQLANVVTTIIGERLGNQRTDALSTVTLDQYRISNRLGRGGMSVVYDATHIRTDQRVALKMMSHRLCFDPAAKTSFMREAEIIAAFDHAHIPRLLDRFDAFSTSFIAMQFVDGDSLSDLIAEQAPFSEDATLKVLGTLTVALMYAHQNGIVHRDVKPANCMVDQTGHITLMDFGLSIPFVSADDSELMLVGTPAYMSPEQFRGEVRTESDWFSLGCVGYEMLTGERLLNPENLLMMARIFENWDVDEIVARLPEETSLAATYLRSLLSLDPEKRTMHLDEMVRHRGTFSITTTSC